MNDNIRRLQEQIEAEKQKISNCNHDFDKPYYNAEINKEAYGYKMIAHGSDVWYEPEGYRDVKKDRWTRKCKICEVEQHTYTLKPIITGQEPSF